MTKREVRVIQCNLAWELEKLDEPGARKSLKAQEHREKFDCFQRAFCFCSEFTGVELPCLFRLLFIDVT